MVTSLLGQEAVQLDAGTSAREGDSVAATLLCADFEGRRTPERLGWMWRWAPGEKTTEHV